MEKKLRVLFYNIDGAGVNYFRTLTPATEIERSHSDKIYVDIIHSLDFEKPETFEYLKSFDIIHYHRQLHPDITKMRALVRELRKSGVVLIMDIDDYWDLHKLHPYHAVSRDRNIPQLIKDNLKIADYVTTTTEIFAEEIRKVTGKDNVSVFYNSINPEWMKQFQDNWKPDPNGRVRITYMAGSCYDDQTEILTDDGWKLFADLDKTEKVATLNPKTNELEYQKPSEYIDEYYGGEMYFGSNKNIDIAVTPNHNMYVSKVKSANRKKPFKFELVQMENLDDYDLTFKKDCIWNGDEKEFFVLEKYETKLKVFDEIKFKMEDWLMFFGFWLGDGWTTSDDSKQVGICGVKENSINRMGDIEKMLISYGYEPKWTKDRKQLRIFNQQLWGYLSQFGKAKDKYIPKEIKNLSSNKLRVLYDNYIITDGHKKPNGRKTSYGVSKKLSDDFSEIALKIGTCATVKNRGIKESIFLKEIISSNGEVIQEERCVVGKSDAHSVNYYLTEGKKPQVEPTLLRKNIKKDFYFGRIYCVTVPNHILYVRRNGKSYWCGNSHWVDVQQLIGVVNVLSIDPELKDKFKIIIAGWDTEGSTTDITFNQEFGVEMQSRGLWTRDIVRKINNTRGNVDAILEIPSDLREKYRNNVFLYNKRDIHSRESIYFTYEKILTNDHKMITNQDYLQWLMNFERNLEYPEEGNFARRWTQKANIYAKVLDETDIVIAPLSDNTFNRMKCVVGDTLVNTNKGIVKIGDLFEEKCGDLKIMNNNVISFFKYENEETIKLKTNIGVEIEGTPTHRLFVNNQWKSISEFKIGDKIELTPFTFEVDEYQKIFYPMLLSKKINKENIDCVSKEMMLSITINEDYGRFFGYMVGDGHFSTNYLRISCDSRYDDVVNDVISLGKKMGLSPFTIVKKPDSRCKTSTIKDGFGVDINFTSIHLANMCIRENLKNNNGKVFEVPRFILKSPKSVIREFLRGLFEVDGTVTTDGSKVSLTSKSLVLIKQIQTLLLGFGVVGKIGVALNKRYRRNYYNLNLSSVASDVFYREIGFVSEKKQEKLKLISEKSHSNRYTEQEFECFVTEITKGRNDVFDVEVENIHKYIGNGIINHNSNLKQVECWTRKLPIVCSDIPPYNVHGRHMENCVLIPLKPSEKHAHKEWKKYLKKLILDADLRKRLGEQLHEDFKESYNLKNVTAKRVQFYKEVVAEKVVA